MSSTRSRRLLVLTSVAIFASLCPCIIGSQEDFVAAAPCTSPTAQTVSVTIQNPDGTQLDVQNVPWIPNCTVWLAMQNARSLNPQFTFDTQYFCPYGSYVVTINGFNESGDHYWALLVNDAMATAGIDTQLLQPNDRVLWKVESVTSPTHNPESHQSKMLTLRNERRIDKALKAAHK